MSLAHTPPLALGGLRYSSGALAALLCACLQPPSRPSGPSPGMYGAPSQEDGLELDEGFPHTWNPGEALLQGYIGATYLSDFTVSPSGAPPIGLEDDEYEVLPVVGGGAQWKLAGRSLDFGVEGFVAFSGRSDLAAFASSGGTTVVAFDVSLLVLELYGGPFVSLFASDRLRLYGSAGPLLQWVSYDQDDGVSEQVSTDGSGGGVYARAGFEFLLPSRKLVGLGVRWSDSSVNFSSDFGELDLSGFEVFVTYSYRQEPRGRYGWP